MIFHLYFSKKLKFIKMAFYCRKLFVCTLLLLQLHIHNIRLFYINFSKFNPYLMNIKRSVDIISSFQRILLTIVNLYI